jgi:hypothetical protein
MTCPECNGKCCRDTDYGYWVEHMGAEVYMHSCDNCDDGKVPQPQPPKRTREEILADWDAKELKDRQMCAQWLLKLVTCTHQHMDEASVRGWHATAADMAEGARVVNLAIELLAHEEED